MTVTECTANAGLGLLFGGFIDEQTQTRWVVDGEKLDLGVDGSVDRLQPG